MMVKTVQQIDLSESTTSYDVKVEISSEKSLDDYFEEYSEQRARLEHEHSKESD